MSSEDLVADLAAARFSEREWRDKAYEKTAEVVELEAALRRIAEQQPRVLAYIRREGFVFDGNLADYEGWKKLAFSIYTDLCEVDVIARTALKQETTELPSAGYDPDHPLVRCGDPYCGEEYTACDLGNHYCPSCGESCEGATPVDPPPVPASASLDGSATGSEASS